MLLIDGETLRGPTENMNAVLIPQMKMQVKFIQLRQQLLREQTSVPTPNNDVSSAVDVDNNNNGDSTIELVLAADFRLDNRYLMLGNAVENVMQCNLMLYVTITGD